MRIRVKLAGIASVLAIGACSSGDRAMSDDLKKDLQMASSASSISLASSQTVGNQVVSAIERTTPPAPRRIAPSQRVVKHRPAPRGTPAPVEVEEADVSEEVEAQPVEPAPAPAVETEVLPSPRPQPILVSDGGDRDGRSGSIDRGRVIGGIITVVLRGGGVDGDECELHDGRGRGRIAINNRIPVIGTFPGSVGTYPGRQVSRPVGNFPSRIGNLPGRVRF